MVDNVSSGLNFVSAIDVIYTRQLLILLHICSGSQVMDLVKRHKAAGIGTLPLVMNAGKKHPVAII